jgi:hypothetical protein
MYIPFRNSKNWVVKQVEDCKNLPEVNSRLCFLGTSIVICFCMLVLTIGVFFSDRAKEVYEGGIAVLLGGHGVTAWGRYKTKGPVEDGPSGSDNGNGNSGGTGAGNSEKG